MKTTVVHSLLIALAIVSISGCQSMNQAYSVFGQNALKDSAGFEDNAIGTWRAAACGTPFSAVVRNPDIQPALGTLCKTNSANTSQSSQSAITAAQTAGGK
jgi:hypothetical protein